MRRPGQRMMNVYCDTALMHSPIPSTEKVARISHSVLPVASLRSGDVCPFWMISSWGRHFPTLKCFSCPHIPLLSPPQICTLLTTTCLPPSDLQSPAFSPLRFTCSTHHCLLEQTRPNCAAPAFGQAILPTPLLHVEARASGHTASQHLILSEQSI